MQQIGANQRKINTAKHASKSLPVKIGGSYLIQTSVIIDLLLTQAEPFAWT